MEKLDDQDDYELSPEEFAKLMRPTAELAVKKSLEMGLYFSYPAGTVGIPGTFIHKYADGKKILVYIDEFTGEERFLKNL